MNPSSHPEDLQRVFAVGSGLNKVWLWQEMKWQRFKMDEFVFSFFITAEGCRVQNPGQVVSVCSEENRERKVSCFCWVKHPVTNFRWPSNLNSSISLFGPAVYFVNHHICIHISLLSGDQKRQVTRQRLLTSTNFFIPWNRLKSELHEEGWCFFSNQIRHK